MILARHLFLLAPILLASGGMETSDARSSHDSPDVLVELSGPDPAPLAAVAPVPASVAPARSSALTEMIVFGASRSDSGNAFFLTGGFLPAPPYWEGRFCNGPNWVDQLAVLLGLPVPGPSELGGTNYSAAGAGSGTGFSNSCFGSICTPNMGLQIEYFLDGAPVIDGDELFVLRGGGNDFGQFTGLHNATMAAYNMRVNIETLAQAGADKFAVINLGVDNWSPIKWNTSNNEWILRFNAMLEQHLQQLESELGLTIARVDYHSLHIEIIADPGAFGLTNMTEPAFTQGTVVPNPDEYFFWDLVHPTTAVHVYIANLAASSVSEALGL